MHRRLAGLVGLALFATLVACGGTEGDPPPLPAPAIIEIVATPLAIPVANIPPVPTAVPSPFPTEVIERYTVRNGDTLGAIAARYDISIGDLMKLNGMSNPNALQIGKVLKVIVSVPRTGPGDWLLPDSEAVDGPSSANFDVSAYVTRAGGYLSGYREKVDGDSLTGAQVIQLAAERYSVGPRLLLALLEYEGGWVTGTGLSQSQVNSPFGIPDPNRTSLFVQASIAANRLNEGFYGRKSGQLAAYRLKDRSRVRVAPAVNAGTAAVQNFFSYLSNYDAWARQVSPGGFIATFRRLFGDPAAFAVEPLIPPDLKQPTMRLPWGDGNTWFYTGGPHSPWGDYAAWGAIDVTPGDLAGSGSCASSRDWVISAAPGRVLRAERGRVTVSVGDGNFQGSGWSLMYLHIATDGRVAEGAIVNVGDRIGHPSCEGGDSDASHLHFARLYNGQWIDPQTVPFVLSGWNVLTGDQQYDGKLVRGAEERIAVDGRDPSNNAVVGDPGK